MRFAWIEFWLIASKQLIKNQSLYGNWHVTCQAAWKWAF